jgi:hypothetical protein
LFVVDIMWVHHMTYLHAHMWPTAFVARSRSIFDWRNVHKISTSSW